MFSTGNKTVDILATMHFEGNIIPHTWYKVFRQPNGKPDVIAMMILSEAVYWYRPTYVRQEQTGATLGIKKKFAADMLQKSYDDLEEQFGFSTKQIREALKRLETVGVLFREFRTITKGGVLCNNVMFLNLNPTKLAEITFPKLDQVAEDEGGYFPGGKEGVSPEGKRVFPSREGGSFPERKEGVSLEGKTNTEITTKITTKNTNNIKPLVEQSSTEGIPYEDIIEYLNLKAGKNFKASTKEHRKYIKDRWNDGYRLPDFKKVIDVKVADWKDDKRNNKYLQPSTLFGGKFDNYLNQEMPTVPLAANDYSFENVPKPDYTLADYIQGGDSDEVYSGRHEGEYDFSKVPKPDFAE